MITLENWRERMRADMGLRDYRPRTRDGYELATRLFLGWAKTVPAALTEEHVRGYFLFLLGRDWPVFELLRVNKPRMLPTVLSTTEIRPLLAASGTPSVAWRSAPSTRSGCGSGKAFASRRRTSIPTA